LKTVINDELVLTEGKEFKNSKEFNNKSCVIEEYKGNFDDRSKAGLKQFKEQFDKHLTNIKKMHYSSQN